MPKRKKHERLPNAYGSIRYLGKNRKNPYAVHPPCKDISEEGDYIRPKAICYVDDWYVGFAVLNAWHAGTYKVGDENTLQVLPGGLCDRSGRFLSADSDGLLRPCPRRRGQKRK